MPLANLRRNIDAIGLNNLVLINSNLLLPKNLTPRLLTAVYLVQRTKDHSSADV